MRNALIAVSISFILAVSIIHSPAAVTGTLEGIIKYLPDPNRPWKFSRYYIQNSKSGFLAEAIVALEGTNLNGLAPTNAPKTCSMDQVNFQFVPESIAVR